jgi:four helix bundle protein
MQDFRKLKVWDASVALAENIYRMTSDFPPAQRFGLRSQLRSAAVSISSNIAEGAGRRTNPDTAHFLQIAIGSSCEVESQVLVSNRLGLLPDPGELLDEIDHVRRQLIRLVQSLTPQGQ